MNKCKNMQKKCKFYEKIMQFTYGLYLLSFSMLRWLELASIGVEIFDE